MNRPRLVPVIDVQRRQVVHARGGIRTAYQPLPTEWFPSTDPVAVAHHLLKQWQVDQIYMADLDAITTGHLDPTLYIEMLQAIAPAQLWLDAGVRHAHDITRLRQLGVQQIIVGTETAPGLSILTDQSTARLDDVIISIDLRNNQMLGYYDQWGAKHPGDVEWVVEQVVQVGGRRLIVLDLAQVGMGEGPTSGPLCRQLKHAHPTIEIVTGGGIRDDADIEMLRRAGVDAVLVGTALWKGTVRSGLD